MADISFVLAIAGIILTIIDTELTAVSWSAVSEDGTFPPYITKVILIIATMWSETMHSLHILGDFTLIRLIRTHYNPLIANECLFLQRPLQEHWLSLALKVLVLLTTLLLLVFITLYHSIEVKVSEGATLQVIPFV